MMQYNATMEMPKAQGISYSKKLIQQYHTERSTIKATESEKFVTVYITAKDITAFTAAINSVLRETKLVGEISSISHSSTKK